MQSAEIITEFILYSTTERRLSVHAISALRYDLSSFVRYSNGVEVEILLSVEMIRAYSAYMFDELKRSPSTVRRHLASIRGLCRYSEEHHGLHDPFRDWSPKIKRPKRLPRAVSIDEAQILTSRVGAISEEQSETLWILIFLGATGLRVSELCKLTAGDISSDGGTASISGKGSKERIVYVGNVELRQWLIGCREKALEIAGLDSAVFRNSRGRQLQPQTLRSRIHKLCELRGIQKRITPHMFRHSAATWLIENGTDIRIVQRLLGHASISTTEIYTHVSDIALREAIYRAETVDRLTSG